MSDLLLLPTLGRCPGFPSACPTTIPSSACLWTRRPSQTGLRPFYAWRHSICSAAASSVEGGIVTALQGPTWDQHKDVFCVHQALGYSCKPSTEAELLACVSCVLRGLKALHACGLVHRDVRCDTRHV